MRLESQLKRCKTSSETAEKVEEELKQERRKLQREVRRAKEVIIIIIFKISGINDNKDASKDDSITVTRKPLQTTSNHLEFHL